MHEPKPEAKPEPKAKSNGQAKSKKAAKSDPPADAEADAVPIDQQTIRQLRDIAKRLGIELPKNGKRAELVAVVRDGTRQAA